jgi:saccharopine dehydrogenase (NAD+, L-lysine-forming)
MAARKLRTTYTARKRPIHHKGARRLYKLAKPGAGTVAGVAGQVSVAVLGAAGTIAPAIVHDLARSEEVERLRLLDLDGPRAGGVAGEHGAGRADAHEVDARNPDALAAVLDGVDVLVNTASYRVNLDAMRACLAAGCHYLDLGGLYWMTTRQLSLDDEFRSAGLLAVLGIGSSPGKTNLMAAEAVDRAGGAPVRSIEVAAAGRDPVAHDDGRFRPPYAVQTLLDELTLRPVVLREGSPVEIDPLAPGGSVDFGEPIGAAETIFTLHSELATFGESFGCEEASFRLSLAPAVETRLRELVGAPPEEVEAAAREAAPASSETVSVHLVQVGTADGATVTVRAVTEPHFGLGGSIVSTAAPAAAAVRLLARGSLSPERHSAGVKPPERCLDREEMFAELRARGCSFSVTD